MKAINLYKFYKEAARAAMINAVCQWSVVGTWVVAISAIVILGMIGIASMVNSIIYAVALVIVAGIIGFQVYNLYNAQHLCDKYGVPYTMRGFNMDVQISAYEITDWNELTAEEFNELVELTKN